MEESAEMKKMVETARGRQKFTYQGRTVYEWEQTIDEIHIYIQPPPNVYKEHFDIDITSKKVKIGLKNNPPFINELLYSLIIEEDSYWMIEDKELHIQMTKSKKGEIWECCFKQHNALDPFSHSEVQKKIMLERFQEEHPGFDFSSATFSGASPNPRTFMGGVKYT
eukprot:GHVR01137564.1.p1 GENE.GHVR01137564.1~~GHVR01137564.1.p1  ORF type:complete len:166 (+),score=36.97 GHVR01137564.1:65-562(+)